MPPIDLVSRGIETCVSASGDAHVATPESVTPELRAALRIWRVFMEARDRSLLAVTGDGRTHKPTLLRTAIIRQCTLSLLAGQDLTLTTLHKLVEKLASFQTVRAEVSLLVGFGLLVTGKKEGRGKPTAVTASLALVDYYEERLPALVRRATELLVAGVNVDSPDDAGTMIRKPKREGPPQAATARDVNPELAFMLKMWSEFTSDWEVNFIDFMGGGRTHKPSLMRTHIARNTVFAVAEGRYLTLAEHYAAVSSLGSMTPFRMETTLLEGYGLIKLHRGEKGATTIIPRPPLVERYEDRLPPLIQHARSILLQYAKLRQS